MYPPAPWKLNGYAFQTLHLVDSDRARSFIPSTLEIFSVFPGKTLGGVYLSAYETGSVLEYNELIVVPGLVRYQNQVGVWVSHIYVDNPDSVAGGREIWGLPKEIAQFTWTQSQQAEEENHVMVKQGDRLLCSLSYDWRWSIWHQKLALPALSQLGTHLLKFEGQADATFSLVGGRLMVPPESPFAPLNLGQPWLTAGAEAMQLVVTDPKQI